MYVFSNAKRQKHGDSTAKCRWDRLTLQGTQDHHHSSRRHRWGNLGSSSGAPSRPPPTILEDAGPPHAAPTAGRDLCDVGPGEADPSLSATAAGFHLSPPFSQCLKKHLQRGGLCRITIIHRQRDCRAEKEAQAMSTTVCADPKTSTCARLGERAIELGMQSNIGPSCHVFQRRPQNLQVPIHAICTVACLTSQSVRLRIVGTPAPPHRRAASRQTPAAVP